MNDGSEKYIDLSSNAPAQDRLGAALFDILIVMLPVSLAVIAPLRAGLIQSLLLGQDLKVSLTVGLIATLFFFVFFGYLFVCYYLFRCTFGQKVFGLKLVSILGQPDDLLLTQAALRALTWPLGAVFIVPLFATFGHPHRRPLHDRLSDTKMISFRKNAVEVTPFSRGFYRGAVASAWLFGLSLVGGSASFIFSYVNDETILVRHLEQSEDLCREVGDALKEWSGQSQVAYGVERLDVALSLFLAKALKKECLEKEVEILSQVLRFEDARLYFARWLLTTDEVKKEAYHQRLCKLDPEADLCLMARSESQSVADLKKSESWSWPALISLIQKAKAEERYDLIANLTSQIIPPRALGAFFAQIRAESLWFEAKPEEARSHLLSSLGFLSPQKQRKMAAWACQEELDLDCGSTQSPVCHFFRQQIREESKQIEASDESLALVTLHYCEDPSAAEWMSLQSTLRSPRYRTYAKAVQLLVEGNHDQARSHIQELLPRAKGQLEFLLKKLLLSLSPSNEEIDKILSDWKTRSVDGLWYKQGRVIFDYFFEKGQFIKATEVGRDLLHSFVDNQSFSQNLVLSSYHAGLKPLAWQYLQSYQRRFDHLQIDSERQPASQREFSVIAKVLEKEFAP